MSDNFRVIRKAVTITIGIVGLEACLHRLVGIHLQFQGICTARVVTGPCTEDISTVWNRGKCDRGTQGDIPTV